MFDRCQGDEAARYTDSVLLRDLPRRARWYVGSVIALGTATLVLLVPFASYAPIPSLAFLILLSSLTAAYKVQFPIASGSNMSVSYVVDIAVLILRGPHPAMFVGAVSAWCQSVWATRRRNPPHRTLFNMACLIMTVQAAGQVYQRLGGTPHITLASAGPVLGMALTYFLVNTVPIAIAIGLTTDQRALVVWRSEFLPTLTSYLFGALAAAVAIAVMESSGYWLTLLLAALPLYLTWNVYRAGVESEARQGAILEAANDAIISVDQDQRIREFNPAAERMFGWRRLEILGKPVDMLMPAATRKRQLEAILQYLAKGDGPLAAGHQVETVARRASGAEFRVEISVARVGEGRASRITGFVRDITERRALEEQLRQSQKLEAIGRLASGVAHDFNNLLMSIVGSADLLLMQLMPDDPLRAEASEIKRSVQRGAGLTRQLLAFSRRQATSPRLVALDDVVGGMEVMLRRLIGPEVELEIARATRPVMVMADPGQLEQVILNLVINGRDAMPEGGRLSITLAVTDAHDAAEPGRLGGRGGRSARLSVSDTGTGIDTATRARLFEPFFTTKAENKGSGLGLSIVYGIVKQNGGSVEVVSERGKGATFHVYLPLAASGDALAAAPAVGQPISRDRLSR